MSTLIEQLEQRVSLAKKELEEAREKMHSAQKMEQLLNSELQGYLAALEGEKRRAGAPFTSQQAPSKEEIIPSIPERPADENKSELARRLLISKENAGGVSPKDIRQAFIEHNFTFHQGYPYNLLHRMKASNLIFEKDGKYFPTPTLKQKALP